MAVMQTPHGRVVGLIICESDQPKAQPEGEKKPTRAAVEKAEPVKKAEAAKRPGRPAKK